MEGVKHRRIGLLMDTGGTCRRKSRKSGGSYPAYRPTMAQCKSAKVKATTFKKTSANRVNLKTMSYLVEKQPQFWV